LDGLKPLIDNGEMLDDAAKVGAVIARLAELVGLLQRQFYALADNSHLRAELRAPRLDRAPQRRERSRRVPGVLGRRLPCESFPVVVRHGVSYRSSPMLRPRVRLCSSSRAIPSFWRMC